MDREIKIIEIYEDDFSEDLCSYIIPPEEFPTVEDEGYSDDLINQELIDIPDLGFLFVYYYNGQISHFFTEDMTLETYFKNIDDPAYTPVPGTFDYFGDGLDIIDQPAHVIIKEVLKKRGYIKE